MKFFTRLKEDRLRFDRQNQQEDAVLSAFYFSAYRGIWVWKLPIGKNAASFGVLFIGRGVTDISTVRHEYGHTFQLQTLGLWRYILHVAIPSVIGNLLNRAGKLPYDYYGSPWESEADYYGGVVGRACEPWPESVKTEIGALIKLFFAKSKESNRQNHKNYFTGGEK